MPAIGIGLGGMSLGSGGGASNIGQTLLPNVVAFYKFDEPAGGGNRFDSTLNRRTMVPVNDTGQVVGHVGNAVSFVSANVNYLQSTTIAGAGPITFAGKDFTITGWIRFTTFVNFGSYISDSNGTFEIRGSGVTSTLTFWWFNGSVNCINPTSLTAGTWYFFCAQRDVTNKIIQLSINNGAFTSLSYVTDVTEGNPTFMGLEHLTTSPANGSMDSVGIWTSTPGNGGLLTTKQITYLYNTGNGIQYPFGGAVGTDPNGLAPSFVFRADRGQYSDQAGTVLATDGQAVASFRDQSVNGALVVQPTSANQATYEATGGPNCPALFFGGLAQYPLPAGLSYSTQAFTFYAVIRFRAMEENGYLISLGSGTNNLAVYDTRRTIGLVGNGAGFNFPFGVTVFTGDPPLSFHVVSVTSGPSGVTIKIDGVSSTTTAMPLATALNGFLGCLSAGNQNFIGELVDMYVHPATHSAATVLAVEQWISNTRKLPQTINLAPTKMLVCDGDSITAGVKSLTTVDGDWPALVKATLGATWNVLNFGITGQTLNGMANLRGSNIDGFWTASRSKNILIVWGGTNDIANSATAAATYAVYQTYGVAAHLIGWKVIIVTAMTRTDITGAMQTQRGIFNTDLRTDFAVATGNIYVFTPASVTYADAMVDADALQVATGFTFPDGIHPNEAGYVLLAPAFAFAVGLF